MNPTLKRILLSKKQTALPTYLNYRKSYEVWEDCVGTTGWSGSYVSEDTANYKTGTSALKLSALAGGNRTTQKTISINFKDKNKPLSFAIYVYDKTKVSDVVLYLSSTTDYSKMFSKSITSLLVTGWNIIYLKDTDWTNTGTDSWDNTMIRCQLRVTAVSAQDAIVTFDDFQYNIVGNPRCVITFDDAYDTVYSAAYPVMSARGLKGTCYLVSDWIGTGSYLTGAHADELYNAGWAIGNHFKDHADPTTLTQAQIETEISACATVLQGRGYTRSYKHVAYPYANVNGDADTLAAMAAQGMLTGRDGINKTQFVPQANYYGLCSRQITAATSLATFQGYVDEAISYGGTLNLMFHGIDSAGGNNVTVANFTSMMDYLVTKGIKCVSIDNWYNGLSGVSA